MQLCSNLSIPWHFLSLGLERKLTFSRLVATAEFSKFAGILSAALSPLVPIFAWNVPLVSLIFLKRSLVFPMLLFSSLSLHWSLRKAFLSLLAILWNSAFRWVYLSFSPLPFAFLSYLWGLLRQPFLPFCISFSWGCSWSLPPVQCHKPLSIVLQALSDLMFRIYLSLPLYSCKRFDLGHIWIALYFSLLSSI